MDDIITNTVESDDEETTDLVPEDYIVSLVSGAKAASGRVAILPSQVKNQALSAMAEGLDDRTQDILAANEGDLDAFESRLEQAAVADRLRLTQERIAAMAAGIRDVAKLPDPLGAAPRMWTRPNGMQVGRMKVPIGRRRGTSG